MIKIEKGQEENRFLVLDFDGCLLEVRFIKKNRKFMFFSNQLDEVKEESNYIFEDKFYQDTTYAAWTVLDQEEIIELINFFNFCNHENT